VKGKKAKRKGREGTSKERLQGRKERAKQIKEI